MERLIASLCHYTTGAVAFEHILPSKKIRMSPYGRMRDPLENRQLAFTATAEVEEQVSRRDPLFDLGWFVQLVRDRMVLLSLAQDAEDGYRPEDEPFMRAWARAPLWEYYADNHCGVCIAFDPASLMDDISSALAGRGGATAAHPVVYLPRGFADTETSQVDLGQLDPYDLPALAPWVIEHQHDLFFVKARDWNSEHEFRVVHSPPEPSEDGYVYVPFRAESVRAVILGEQFPRAELPAARVACDRAELEMFRIEWRSGLPQPIPVSQ